MITGIGNIAPLSGTQSIFPEAKTAEAATGDAFSAMVTELATNTVARLENAEGLSFKALEGEAETRAVVDAVMSAEQSLQAAIAIRDKIVTAYLDISRMAI
ncbi:flagellar hook-basal body complex protein FliE [Chelativorans salis]|uniref:Flagellar hook-basal body complex protein FliE n=1 Tax=Chelativorans salis TaxID=2978478 RepID=A0ABT2LVH7_9HYPH|nr:flagellar hook-basal body complex protein FliE [Chelativorans sp. EGI FJ00035]MCT7377578.1 flagellar hook-basal body complex protein FliE [Chelativorans sp. EGI FJ00035]